jgi:hypothetical protein
MKAIVVIAASALLASIAGAYSFGLVKLDVGAHAGICAMDTEIAEQDRSTLDAAAMKYVEGVLSPNPGDAYAMMTKEAQSAVSLDQFTNVAIHYVQAMGPHANIRVAHTYFIHSVGNGPDTRAICGTLANYQWVSAEIKPGLPQAYVEVGTHTRNNDWAFTLWMSQEGSSWRIENFHPGASSIVGQTPEMLLTSARSERAADRTFNAAMLYAGVKGTIDRGPTFQLGIAQELQEDLSKFSMPTELQGQPPFTWKIGGQSYLVDQASIIGIDKQLGLMFVLPLNVWKGNDDADQNNRAFIHAFIATHSDFSRAFRFLAARALKPDKSGGFGTVYEVGKGFD